jgi:hypothetical protein
MPEIRPITTLSIGTAIIWPNPSDLWDRGPWRYFYAEDGFFTFVVIAPLSVALLSGLLTKVPEQRAAS